MKTYNRNEILEQLQTMGVPQDVPVLMHTSLRAVGPVEGRGEALLEILIEHVTAKGGLFCVPTHTWGNLRLPITLDLADPKTCIGAFTEIAARSPLGVRTPHATHSMKVFGDPDRVREFVAGEGYALTPDPEDGCYGRLVKEGGKVLLVGVGHNRNTFLHSVEEMLDVPNRLSAEPRSLCVRFSDGRIEERRMRIHKAEGIGDVSAFYPKYEPAFRYHGAIRDGFIGNAATQLCDARKMKEVLSLVRERSGGVELLANDAPLKEEYYKERTEKKA